ncbi:MAG TPA: hypothetical protein VFW79_10875, partial [Cellulomonas sp.]|nr:hypothetical protein [Cellulomonas sp.]
MNRDKLGRAGSAAGTYTVFMILLIAVLYPLLWMVMSSLKTRFTIFANPFSLPRDPTFANYARALSQGKFGLNL